MPTSGVLLPNGCRVTHGTGATVKQPFPDIPLVMHELHGGDDDGTAGFAGQFGFIPFTDAMRLPRHVHLAQERAGRGGHLLAERILVVNGVALTELNGEVLLVAPGSLVDIAPGVPHSWTACPAGVRLPNGTVSDGRFLMIYEYAERTSFAPVEGTAPLADAGGYRPYRGDLDAIRFPLLTPRQVVECASFVLDAAPRRDLATA